MRRIPTLIVSPGFDGIALLKWGVSSRGFLLLKAQDVSGAIRGGEFVPGFPAMIFRSKGNSIPGQAQFSREPKRCSFASSFQTLDV